MELKKESTDFADFRGETKQKILTTELHGGKDKTEGTFSLYIPYFLNQIDYSKGVDFNIEFNQAAFTHKITEDDIRFAFDTARYDGSIDEDDSDNKYIIIGFDRKANPLEIMYNVIDENTINVFHAMKCRKNYLHLIRTRGEDNG